LKNHTFVAEAQLSFHGGDRVAVLLPLPLTGAYDYRVADGMALASGDFVEVPLAARTLTGVVWGPGHGAIAEAKLKPVRFRLAAPPLPAVSRRFVEWVAAYTVSAPGAVLRMAMPVPDALRPSVPAVGYVRGEAAAALKATPARARVLTLLEDGLPRPAAEIAREAAVSAAVVRGLIAAGALVKCALSVPEPPPAPDWRRPGLVLSAAQRAAAERLQGAIGAGFSVTLLDGAAGSGKTEVYFEAIARALAQPAADSAAGAQVLVLLPEIALGAQWLMRFAARFGTKPLVWHSEIGAGERKRTFRAVADGRARVIVGARSALFLPFPNLALIVVDEEHESSFKQEDGVTYHARDMAVVRARLGQIPVVLVSATPSLETVANVGSGRYGAVVLPSRHAVAPPAIELVDLRCDPPPKGGFLAPTVRHRIATTLQAGCQVLLFLNRRGYAPLTLCSACGHRLCCPHCTAWLVEHRLSGRLQCHHCGHAQPIPTACPACGRADSLVACGPGVERLSDEVAALFPAARTVLATSDRLTGPGAAAALVTAIEAHAVDIIIGTQIVAKGYHFPLLTLVGVVDGDLGLAGGDLRAAERTFQLLSQVAGRAGRAERPGQVLLQTHMPEHPVMRALQASDRERFLAAEAAARRETAMPPFGRLAAIIVSSADEAAAEAACRRLAQSAPRMADVRVLGPAPAPLALLRGRHRRRLLVHAGAKVSVSRLMRDWLATVQMPGSVRVQVDIDPMSFL
jgi:primosomal protein N' (replication factor Y)